MGKGQRLGLVVAALVVAVVAFVVLGSEDTDEKADDPVAERPKTVREPTATAESAPAPPPDEVVLKGGRPEGGAGKVTVKKGDLVRLVVSSDKPDDIHLHGYDVTRKARPGKPARFRLRANVEGQFEIESHVAEDAGEEALVATLVVEPA